MLKKKRLSTGSNHAIQRHSEFNLKESLRKSAENPPAVPDAEGDGGRVERFLARTEKGFFASEQDPKRWDKESPTGWVLMADVAALDWLLRNPCHCS